MLAMHENVNCFLLNMLYYCILLCFALIQILTNAVVTMNVSSSAETCQEHLSAPVKKVTFCNRMGVNVQVHV